MDIAANINMWDVSISALYSLFVNGDLSSGRNAGNHWAYLRDLLYTADRKEARRRNECSAVNTKRRANPRVIEGDKPGPEAPLEVSDSPGGPNMEVVQGFGRSPVATSGGVGRSGRVALAKQTVGTRRGADTKGLNQRRDPRAYRGGSPNNRH